MGLTDFSTGVQGGLQQLLAQRLQAQKYADQLKQQDVENQFRRQDIAQRDSEFQQRNALAVQSAHAASANKLFTQGQNLDERIPGGTRFDPANPADLNTARTISAGGGLLTGIPVLPSTQIQGAAPDLGGPVNVGGSLRTISRPADSLGAIEKQPTAKQQDFAVTQARLSDQFKQTNDRLNAPKPTSQQWVTRPGSADPVYTGDIQAGDRPYHAPSTARPSSGSGSVTDVKEIADAIERGDDVPDLSRLYGKASAVRAELDRRRVPLRKLTLDWQASQAFTKSLNNSQTVRFQALGNSVVNTIDELNSIAEELKQGNVQKFNQAKRSTVLQVFGNSPQSQLAARYVSTTAALQEELASLVSGGYSPQEAGFALAKDMVNKDYGFKDMEAALKQTQRLLNYRLKAPYQIQPMSPQGMGGSVVPDAPATTTSGAYDYTAFKKSVGMK